MGYVKGGEVFRCKTGSAGGGKPLLFLQKKVTSFWKTIGRNIGPMSRIIR